MRIPYLTLRARWVALSALLALIWSGAPHLAGGLWRGIYFACLCSADVVAEFRDGGVFTHMNPCLVLQGRPPSAARFRPSPLDHIATPGGTHSSGRSQQATVRCSAFSSFQVGFSVELSTRNCERCGGVCVSTILLESCGSEGIVTVLSNWGNRAVDSKTHPTDRGVGQRRRRVQYLGQSSQMDCHTKRCRAHR